MAYYFEKVYTLIAQTPMIHFQHDQTGATLRATEVKPKLDRYLLACANKEGIAKETLDSWHVGFNPKDKKRHEKTYKGLHYQMRIEKRGKPVDREISLDDCKFYFGNQGTGDKLVFNNCELKIECFIPALMEFIDKHIGDFFVLHNFGTRQTKGFGGFRVKDQTDEAIEKAIQDSVQLFFYTEVPDGDRESILNRMNHALTVYSVMKNGLNMTRYNENRGTYLFSDRYIKGFAMRPYFEKVSKTPEVGSDKAFIKSSVHKANPVDDQKKEKLDRDYKEYTFIRALLGLAEQYEFRDRYRNNGIRVNPNTQRSSYQPVGVSLINCPKNEDGSPKINPRMSLEDVKKLIEIQRFPSPVKIKIYQNRIYFLFDDSYEKMLNQTFLFLGFTKEGRRTNHESIGNCLSNGHYLSTPKDFDMKAFVDNFVSYYNNTVKTQLKEFDAPYVNSKNLTLQKGW